MGLIQMALLHWCSSCWKQLALKRTGESSKGFKEELLGVEGDGDSSQRQHPVVLQVPSRSQHLIEFFIW